MDYYRLDHIRDNETTQKKCKTDTTYDNQPNDDDPAIQHTLPISVKYESPATPQHIFQNHFNVLPNPTDVFAPPSIHCSVCDKVFRSKQLLKQHGLVHSDERKYRCEYCDRAFKQLSHLQQHHRIHTGEKPYTCPIEGCGRAFPQLSNLQHHLRHHNQPTPPASNTCMFCDRVYASETVLRNHVMKIHLMTNQQPQAQDNTSDLQTRQAPTSTMPHNCTSVTQPAVTLPQAYIEAIETEVPTSPLHNSRMTIKQEPRSLTSDEVGCISRGNELSIKNDKVTDTCLKEITVITNALRSRVSSNNVQMATPCGAESTKTVTSSFAPVFERKVVSNNYNTHDAGDRRNYTQSISQDQDDTQASHFRSNNLVQDQCDTVRGVKQQTMILPVQVRNNEAANYNSQIQQSWDSNNYTDISIHESYSLNNVAMVTRNHHNDGDVNTITNTEIVKHVQMQSVPNGKQFPSSNRRKMACKYIPLEKIRSMNNRVNVASANNTGLQTTEDRLRDTVKSPDIPEYGTEIAYTNRTGYDREHLRPPYTANISSSAASGCDNQPRADMDHESHGSVNSLTNHIVNVVTDRSNGLDITCTQAYPSINKGNTFWQPNSIKIPVNQQIQCGPRDNTGPAECGERDRTINESAVTFVHDNHRSDTYNSRYATSISTDYTVQQAGATRDLIQDVRCGQSTDMANSSFANGAANNNMVNVLENEDDVTHGTVNVEHPMDSIIGKTMVASNTLTRNSRKRKSFCPQRVLTVDDTLHSWITIE